VLFYFFTISATFDDNLGVNIDGIIFDGLGLLTCHAIAFAAAMKCFSVNCSILLSNAPLKSHGKANTLLI